jgi:purine-binding chemotaxis protein CheW
MIDLIVFNVSSSRYALNIDNIQRIIQAIDLTEIPNTHEYIDGMMSYEDGVIKVLNFRKLIGLNIHEEDSVEVDDYTQKFIIYEKENSQFAIKVDAIEDIAHIEESAIINNEKEDATCDFLELDGILDLDGVLINIIKTVSLPS